MGLNNIVENDNVFVEEFEKKQREKAAKFGF